MTAHLLFRLLLVCAFSGSSPDIAFFPDSPPVTKGTVDVINATALSPDAKLLATTLQGLVNAREARIYLLLAPWDAFWLEHLRTAGYISGYTTIPLDAALRNYASHIKTVISYDPDLPASINIATMMAAVEDGVVITPETAGEWADNLPATDLRGRWKSNVEAYEWAFEHLFPNMSRQVLACYHPTACNHHLRDYLVSRKVFHFWVTSEAHATGPQANFNEEKALAEKLFAATPANIPVLGFWYSGADPGLDEYTGVGLAGAYGKITVVSDWASNLSFLGSVNVDMRAAVAQYQKRNKAAPLTFDPTKIYLCFDIVESGDAPSYVQSRQHDVWQDPVRGQIPINWSLGPAILDLAPPVAAWYYNQATANDYIYMAISGAGYCHPFRNLFGKTSDPDVAWKNYLTITRQYLDVMDCRDIGLYTDAWKPYNREKQEHVVKRFSDALEPLNTCILGMGRDENVAPDTANYCLNDSRGAIVSHIMTRWPVDYGNKTQEENIEWLVQDIKEHAPKARPGFMHAMALSWAFGPAEIMEVTKQLGDAFVPLTIPQFNDLFRQYHGNN